MPTELPVFQSESTTQYASSASKPASRKSRKSRTSRNEREVVEDDYDLNEEFEYDFSEEDIADTALAHSVWDKESASESTYDEEETFKRPVRKHAVAKIAATELDEDFDLIDEMADQPFVSPTAFQHAGQGSAKKASSASRHRIAKRPRRVKSPRPIAYTPTQNRLRGSEVSILAGQDRKKRDQLNYDLPLDAEDDVDYSPVRYRQDLPEDLEDANDGSSSRTRDRIRRRLDDVDDEDLEDFDDDDEEEDTRPVERPCNEFLDELLSTSIRDIALDVSPPAINNSAQYGGPSRTWSDRSGNIIGTGAMVDLRRGYVILDSGQKIPHSKLSAIDLEAVSDFWQLPSVCLLGNRGGSPYRNWAPQTVTWTASSLCHKPLYFENRQLERYGHSRGPFLQPIHSTVHFFVSLVSLPYQTAISPPNECQYALGFFRPGDCAPWLKDPVPISLQGIRRQALFTTGAAFIP